MKNKTVFVACDTSNLVKVKKIIIHTKTKKLKIIPKFGLQFIYSKGGRKFLENIKNDFWLDLKINDIPQTALSAINSLKDLKKCKYITVHANGGLKMLKAVKKKSKKYNKKLKVLGVTILTSFTNSSIKKVGHTKSVKDLVRKQTLLAKTAKLDGIVCSVHEIKTIKKISKRMEIITPGIRLEGDKLNDQKRVSSPKEAFSNGATSIVIGRSITKNNIRKNIKRLIKELK